MTIKKYYEKEKTKSLDAEEVNYGKYSWSSVLLSGFANIYVCLMSHFTELLFSLSWHCHKEYNAVVKQFLVDTISTFRFITLFTRTILPLNIIFLIKQIKSGNYDNVSSTKVSYLKEFFLGNWTRHSTSSLPSWQSCLPSHL